MAAKKFVVAGEMGTVYRVVFRFLQSWTMSPDLHANGGHDLWRLFASVCGELGVHGDLTTHVVDLARFILEPVVGPFCRVTADSDIFIRERPDRPSDDPEHKMIPINALDHGVLIGRTAGGANGRGTNFQFESTRYAGGNDCAIQVEMSGDKAGWRSDSDRNWSLAEVCRQTDEWSDGWTSLRLSGNAELWGGATTGRRPGLPSDGIDELMKRQAHSFACEIIGKPDNPFLNSWLPGEHAHATFSHAIASHQVVEAFKHCHQQWGFVDYGDNHNEVVGEQWGTAWDDMVRRFSSDNRGYAVAEVNAEHPELQT